MLLKRKRLFYIVLLLLFINIPLFAQNSMFIGDYSINRTEYTQILVNGTLDIQGISPVIIEILFDSRVLDIKSAEGGNGMAITEPTPSFSADYTKLDSARITISSPNASGIINGTICKLWVKGLVFSDSVGFITPIKLYINGNEAGFNGGGGKILVKGNLIFPDFPDNLGDPVPNPFFSSTRLNFSLEEPSKVGFFIYNVAGMLVPESQSDINFFKVFDAATNQQIDINSELGKGGYYVTISPDYYKTASGYYLLIMQTDRSVYHKNLIFNK